MAWLLMAPLTLLINLAYSGLSEWHWVLLCMSAELLLLRDRAPATPAPWRPAPRVPVP